MKPASIRLPYHTFAEQTGTTAAQVAAALHISVRTVNRWVYEGIPIDVADELPGKFGTHPAVVWGPLWEVATTWDLVLAKQRSRQKFVKMQKAADHARMMSFRRRLYAGESPDRFAGRPIGWAVERVA